MPFQHAKSLRALLLLLICLAPSAGCGGPDYQPVGQELSSQIQSGSSFADAQQLLGPPHAPTAAQEKQLQEMFARMPDQIRANAESDQHYAWGNDKQFLAVVVNQEGKIWVVTNRY